MVPIPKIIFELPSGLRVLADLRICKTNCATTRLLLWLLPKTVRSFACCVLGNRNRRLSSSSPTVWRALVALRHATQSTDPDPAGFPNIVLDVLREQSRQHRPQPAVEGGNTFPHFRSRFAISTMFISFYFGYTSSFFLRIEHIKNRRLFGWDSSVSRSFGKGFLVATTRR